MRGEMRSTVATVGADRRGCFSFAPSVARARGAGCKGTEERPCSAGARGGAGAASSRRWTALGLRCAVSGDFIGRGNEVRGIHADCLRVVATVDGGGGRTGGCFGWLHRPQGRGARDSRRLPARRGSPCGTCVVGLCGGVHGGLLRPTSSGAGVEVRGTCADGLRCGVHGAAFLATSSAAVGRGARDSR